jgi:hypothetical protein
MIDFGCHDICTPEITNKSNLKLNRVSLWQKPICGWFKTQTKSQSEKNFRPYTFYQVVTMAVSYKWQQKILFRPQCKEYLLVPFEKSNLNRLES